MGAEVEIAPGARLKVSPPGDPLGASYESTVRAALPSMLRLGLPRRDGEVLPVAADDQLTMFTLLHGRVFRFHALVRRVEEENDSFFIDVPLDAERTERRQFFRLVTRIVPRYAVRLDDAGEEAQSLQAVILDLSGGGTMVQSREYVPAGSRIRLIFGLEGDPIDLDVAALVLACTRPTANAQHYRLHCQFMEPSRSDVERLVRYVYRQQAELRRKGQI
jgi:c-di-GMP-binding flagellar brake protein YcgR